MKLIILLLLLVLSFGCNKQPQIIHKDQLILEVPKELLETPKELDRL